MNCSSGLPSCESVKCSSPFAPRLPIRASVRPERFNLKSGRTECKTLWNLVAGCFELNKFLKSMFKTSEG